MRIISCSLRIRFQSGTLGTLRLNLFESGAESDAFCRLSCLSCAFNKTCCSGLAVCLSDSVRSIAFEISWRVVIKLDLERVRCMHWQRSQIGPGPSARSVDLVARNPNKSLVPTTIYLKVHIAPLTAVSQRLETYCKQFPTEVLVHP